MFPKTNGSKQVISLSDVLFRDLLSIGLLFRDLLLSGLLFLSLVFSRLILRKELVLRAFGGSES